VQERQRVELLAEGADEDGHDEQARQYRALAEAIADVAAAMDP